MHKNKIKRAIIPLAGLGTRIFPMNKIINKAFLPIYHNGMLKPVVMIIIEELLDAGIEKIGLIIREEERSIYEQLFSNNDKYLGRYIENKNYETDIDNMRKSIEYIYEEEPLGLGHAVYASMNFSEGQDLIAILGDHLFKSNIEENCTTQFLNELNKTQNLVFSIKEVPLEMVENYGMVYGKWVEGRDGELLEIERFVEKPTQEFALEYLGINTFGEEKYYCVFGQYTISNEIYRKLEKNIRINKNIKEEIDLTDAISESIKNRKSFALVINGESYDVGLPILYKRAMDEYDSK